MSQLIPTTAQLDEIKPKHKQLVMDLAKEAGVDVRDWANGKGGEVKAASNPAYCFEWSFLEPGKVAVFNLWHSEIKPSNGTLVRQFNLRLQAQTETDNARKRRAFSMDDHVRTAALQGLPVRVIVLDGTIRDPEILNSRSRADKRLLDPLPWAITAYDLASGQCTVTRGAVAEPSAHSGADDDLDEEASAFEGKDRWRFIRHRKRERKFRELKIKAALLENDGRLRCEVPQCDFDFEKTYGKLGLHYAQVHHRIPLSAAPSTGMKVLLKDLAIVCANCHVMIHRNGQCRPLEGLLNLA